MFWSDFCRYGMKRNLISFTPSVQMYQNGHPTHWFLEIQGQRYELENVGDAAEKLISATLSEVASEQTSLTDKAIEFKSLMEALRATIQTWYQINVD